MATEDAYDESEQVVGSYTMFEQNLECPFTTRIRTGERLCAVSLVKRFAWACYFSEEYGLKPTELRYSDTATIAASDWLEEAKIKPDVIRRNTRDWNGQWLYWTEQKPDHSIQVDWPRDNTWNELRMRGNN